MYLSEAFLFYGYRFHFHVQTVPLLSCLFFFFLCFLVGLVAGCIGGLGEMLDIVYTLC